MSVREGRGVGRMTGRGRSGLYEKYESSYLIFKVSRVHRRVHTTQSEESLELSSVCSILDCWGTNSFQSSVWTIGLLA